MVATVRSGYYKIEHSPTVRENRGDFSLNIQNHTI